MVWFNTAKTGRWECLGTGLVTSKTIFTVYINIAIYFTLKGKVGGSRSDGTVGF